MHLQIFLNSYLVRFVLIIFLISTSAPAVICQQNQPPKPKLKVAVHEFEPRGGVSKEDAASLSDAFQSKMIETNQFFVVDRSRIKAILQEQGFQQSEACSQVECIVEVGKISGVEKMFSGTIGKVGSIFTVHIQLIDIATAEIVQSKSRNHAGTIEDLLTEVIPELAGEMAKELTGKEVQVTSGTTGGSSSWLWYTLGGVAVAGGVTALVLSKKSEDKPQTQSLPSSPGFPSIP